MRTTIIGHDEQMAFLRDACDRGKAAAVYLFAGQEGIGKKTVAKYFAQMLNCTSASGRPCGTCVSCAKIEGGTSPDLFMFGPSGKSASIEIDAMRTLKKATALRPYESRYTVFIIDDAHTLKHEAANSLLKILEEIPKQNIVIMVTSFLYRVVPTIISRATVIRFTTVPHETLASELAKNRNLSDHEAGFIARYAAGRIGAALRMSQTDIYAAKNQRITALTAMAEGRAEYGNAKQWEYRDRSMLRDDIALMAVWFRDIWLYQQYGETPHIVNGDRMDDIAALAGRFSEDAIVGMIDVLVDMDTHVDENVNVKIIVDAVIARLRLLAAEHERVSSCTK